MSKKKHKKKSKKEDTSIEILIRLGKLRGGRETIIIDDKKSYKRNKKHKKSYDIVDG